MSPDAFKSTYLPLLEGRLEELLKLPPSPLYDAASWALFSGGKRLRPLLVLATTYALDGNIKAALDPAAALEMVHTYSLIHDDLPCMDDDDFRRGKLTVHKKFDEATAVLAGDFLLTYAFEVLAHAPHQSAEKRLEMIQALARRSGGNGMIGGQILDLEAETKPISLDELKVIHHKKTAELLTCALELGALSAGASPLELAALQQFGQEIGLAFQIIDDVLDVTASLDKHGRAVSSDAINGKTTYVFSLGVDGARDAAHKLLEQSIERIAAFPKKALLEAFAVSLVKRAL